MRCLYVPRASMVLAPCEQRSAMPSPSHMPLAGCALLPALARPILQLLYAAVVCNLPCDQSLWPALGLRAQNECQVSLNTVDSVEALVADINQGRWDVVLPQVHGAKWAAGGIFSVCLSAEEAPGGAWSGLGWTAELICRLPP